MKIPESVSPVTVLPPAASASARESKFVSLKNAVKAYIIVDVNQGDANTVLIKPYQATAVANTGLKVIANATRIWQQLDTDNSAAFTRQADAVNFTTSTATVSKSVIFEIVPTDLDVANGFDCIGVTTGASNSGNIVGAKIVTFNKVSAVTPPTPLAD